MKSHIIGFLLVTLAQIPMPIKIGTTFQNKLRPNDCSVGTCTAMIWPCTVVNENLTNEVICGDWLDYSPGRGRDVEWQCEVMWTVTRILYSWHTRVMTLSWRAPASPAVSQHHLLEHASLTNNAHHASHLEWKETTTLLPLHRPQSINIMRDTDLKNLQKW